MNKTKTLEEHMESLRPRMTGDTAEWAYVLGMIEFYAHDTGCGRSVVGKLSRLISTRSGATFAGR